MVSCPFYVNKYSSLRDLWELSANKVKFFQVVTTLFDSLYLELKIEKWDFCEVLSPIEWKQINFVKIEYLHKSILVESMVISRSIMDAPLSGSFSKLGEQFTFCLYLGQFLTDFQNSFFLWKLITIAMCAIAHPAHPLPPPLPWIA